MVCAIATVVILIEKVVANAWRLILMSPRSQPTAWPSEQSSWDLPAGVAKSTSSLRARTPQYGVVYRRARRSWRLGIPLVALREKPE